MEQATIHESLISQYGPLEPEHHAVMGVSYTLNAFHCVKSFTNLMLLVADVGCCLDPGGLSGLGTSC